MPTPLANVDHRQGAPDQSNTMHERMERDGTRRLPRARQSRAFHCQLRYFDTNTDGKVSHDEFMEGCNKGLVQEQASKPDETGGGQTRRRPPKHSNWIDNQARGSDLPLGRFAGPGRASSGGSGCPIWASRAAKSESDAITILAASKTQLGLSFWHPLAFGPVVLVARCAHQSVFGRIHD
jgi:hypothetical protein